MPATKWEKLLLKSFHIGVGASILIWLFYWIICTKESSSRSAAKHWFNSFFMATKCSDSSDWLLSSSSSLFSVWIILILSSISSFCLFQCYLKLIFLLKFWLLASPADCCLEMLLRFLLFKSRGIELSKKLYWGRDWLGESKPFGSMIFCSLAISSLLIDLVRELCDKYLSRSNFAASIARFESGGYSSATYSPLADSDLYR